MKTGYIVYWTFFLGLFITVIGALLKLMHWPNAELFFIIGVLAWLSFIITSLYEVNTSAKISRSGKLIWTVAFITVAGIAGLVYVLGGRKNVVQ